MKKGLLAPFLIYGPYAAATFLKATRFRFSAFSGVMNGSASTPIRKSFMAVISRNKTSVNR